MFICHENQYPAWPGNATSWSFHTLVSAWLRWRKKTSRVKFPFLILELVEGSKDWLFMLIHDCCHQWMALTRAIGLDHFDVSDRCGITTGYWWPCCNMSVRWDAAVCSYQRSAIIPLIMINVTFYSKHMHMPSCSNLYFAGRSVLIVASLLGLFANHSISIFHLSHEWFWAAQSLWSQLTFSFCPVDGFANSKLHA